MPKGITNNMDKFKIIHHPDTLKSLREGKVIAPISVRLVLSDLCNQNCHFCTFRMENSFTNKLFKGVDNKGNETYNPRRFLDKEKAFEVIDDIVSMGVRSLELTGGGEPTVHPKHVEIIQKAIESGLDLGLITNGVLMKPELINILTKANWCRFSIDAGNAESYSKIRRVSPKSYNKVMENIEKLVKARNKSNSNLVIGTSFIVTDENYKELYDCASNISNLGVDYLRIGYYRTDEGFVAGDFKEVSKMLQKAQQDFNSDNFKILDGYSESSKNMDGPPDYSFCSYQHVNTWIAADYNVYRCCVTSYDKSGLLGSIREQSFKELWFSSHRINNMASFDARSCKQCIYNEKNKAINYALQKSPRHKNFI